MIKILSRLLVMIAMCAVNGETRRLPLWHIRMAQQQGVCIISPNTCVLELVPELKRQLWTECKYWLRKQVCGHNTVLKYECCEGFSRSSEQIGCTDVIPLRNVLETAQELGATLFVQYVLESELEYEFTHSQTAITVFVPTNQAFRNLRGSDKSIFDAVVRSTLLYHIIPGRVLTNQTENDEMLSSSLDEQTLRMNRYANNLYSINCVPIIRKDLLATNGIIHLIDGVLIPSKTWPLVSVPESIINDGRFRELSQLLLESDRIQELRQYSYRTSSYTLFAPLDEAFQKLPPNYLNKIKANSSALNALITAHIIPHTICTMALTSEHNLKSFDGENVKLACNTSAMFIDNAKLTAESILAANGVINVIDSVRIPNSVRSLYELVELRSKLSAFKAALDVCPDFVTLLQDWNQSLSLLAPNNQAFERLSAQQIGNIRDNCRQFVKSHIIGFRLSTNSITDNKVLKTLSAAHSITCRVTRKGMSIDSASIEESDIEGINGVLHVIDEILVLP